MGGIVEKTPLYQIGKKLPAWTPWGAIAQFGLGAGRDERHRERKKDRARARVAAEESKRQRGELATFHAQRNKGGGGPGAPIVTAGQIQSGMSQIREGASAKEVLG